MILKIYNNIIIHGFNIKFFDYGIEIEQKTDFYIGIYCRKIFYV